jgi:uncharacterized membrane protein
MSLAIRVLFAAVLVAFGIIGFVHADFTAPWTPVGDVPGRTALVYVCETILVVTGVGLLLRPRVAAGVLLASLVIWVVLFRVREIVTAPGEFGSWDGTAETLAIVAAALALYGPGIRIAQTIYGITMIPFGLAHFIYPDETVALIPDYLPAHRVLAYATGVAFLAAGVAIVSGVWARLAASLSALQIGLFTVLVWIPRLGTLDDFQWNELAVSIALTAAGCVVAEALSPRQQEARRREALSGRSESSPVTPRRGPAA